MKMLMCDKVIHKNLIDSRRGNVILLKKHCKCQGGMGCLNRRDSHSDCLNELTVDEVWDALEELKVVA